MKGIRGSQVVQGSPGYSVPAPIWPPVWHSLRMSVNQSACTAGQGKADRGKQSKGTRRCIRRALSSLPPIPNSPHQAVSLMNRDAKNPQQNISNLIPTMYEKNIIPWPSEIYPRYAMPVQHMKMKCHPSHQQA